MPELPEVETVRRDLETRIVGKTITAVEVRDKKIASDKSFIKQLTGNKIIAIERRGKLLMFKLKSGQYLLGHMKMTGQLIFKGHDTTAGGHKLSESDLEVPNKFTRIIFSFSDKSKLYFNDMRRFGYMKIVSPEEKEKIVKNSFGIEPLTPDFKFVDFAKLFEKRKTNIKALLLNQKLISGLGNIYVDEACFCAGILPWRKVGTIKTIEIRKLFQCIPHILKIAINNRGTTFSNFVDGAGKKGDHLKFLKVFDRAGEPCRNCKTTIKKTRHAGRGTHYCPNCQK